MNISDHYTRARTQFGQPNISVYGALLGTQSGRDIEVFNSFELNVSDDSLPVVDTALLITRQEQYKQVFPTYDFLGWYSTGYQPPTSKELHVHSHLLAFNESPIYIQMLTSAAMLAKSTSLPIRLYETMMDVGSGGMSFVEAGMKIETAEAERIAVESVAKEATTSVDIGSGAVTHLTSQKNAIQMLLNRINMLVRYTEKIATGELPFNHNIMRQISSMLHRLPTMSSGEFSQQLYEERNNALLTTYLALLTKTVNTTADLVDKYTVATPSPGLEKRQRRGVRGPSAGFSSSLEGMMSM